jgi:ABC-type multidrug transport system ATPase subunit/ABC-type multidrug transport system permease subunit
VIKHSAQTRLPASFTAEMIDEQVEFVIEQLGLESIRDVVIGGDEDFQGQGLSPGDRKKTNIAVELVSSPSVLFLDEPTSGIDASSALTVANIIRSLAHASLTCVAVIHQPRGEIFDLIDDLILLVPGGKVAYQGPIRHVIGWFAQYGYDLPHPKANRTDFLLDVTCGKIQKNGNDEVSNEDWEELWQRDGAAYLSQCNIAEVKISNKILSAEQGSSVLKRVLSRPSWPYLVYTHAKRTILQRLKGNNFKFYLLVHLIAGIIMGIITCGGPLVTLNIPGSYQISCPPGAETLCAQGQRFQIGPACFLINMILGCITIPTAVNTFGREKEISYREAAVGVKPVVYWLGKLIGDLPFCVVGSFVYVAPIVAIAPWRSDTGRLYIAMLLLSIFITGFGYNLSFLFNNPDNATLAGAILAILFNLFGGFVPNLGDPPIGDIFYTHYISRLVVTAELYGSGIRDKETFNNIVPEPWRNPSFGVDVGNMLIIIGVTYVCSYIGIRYNLRKVKL